MSKSGKKAIIMGATSGIGRRVTELMINDGWRLTACGRNTAALAELKSMAAERVETCVVDVTERGAEDDLTAAFRNAEEDGEAVDMYFHISGVGSQNKELRADIEVKTVETNALGWTRMIGVAYRYFAERGGGHIAVISSIAGTRGLGAAPSYSATKAFQNTYIEALSQQAKIRGLGIDFTDVRPGFVRTPLLGESPQYPMLMDVDSVAKDVMDAVEKRKRVVVIDWRWRVVTALWGLIPHWLWRKMKIC